MTSLFKQIKDAILADLNDFGDSKLKPSEPAEPKERKAPERRTPASNLNQFLSNCEKEVTKVEELIERQIELKKQFLVEKENALSIAEKRTYQAGIAAQANEKALEQRALADAKFYTRQAEKLEDSYNKTVEDIVHLENQLQDMKNKIVDMKLKRLELMRRENMELASNRINKSVDGLTERDPFTRFDEVQEQIEDIEIQVNQHLDENSFDVRMAKLEAALKQELEPENPEGWTEPEDSQTSQDSEELEKLEELEEKITNEEK